MKKIFFYQDFLKEDFSFKSNTNEFLITIKYNNKTRTF